MPLLSKTLDFSKTLDLNNNFLRLMLTRFYTLKPEKIIFYIY